MDIFCVTIALLYASTWSGIYFFLLQIFVEFSNPEECRKAHASLAGRKFANRVVVTSFFDPIKFQQKNFVS